MKKILFTLSLLALSGFALPAMAADVAAQTDQNKVVDISAFCAKVDSSAATLDQLLSDSEMKYDGAKAAQKESLADSRKESDASLAKARSDADSSYTEQYKELMATAQTKAQKKAVSDFQKTMTGAINLRRQKVDAAIRIYRNGIDQILGDRAGVYVQALGAFRAAVASAMANAKNDCITDPSSKQAQTTALTAIESARIQYSVQIDGISKDSTDKLDALAVTRDWTVSLAENDFQATATSAAAKLKTVLGQ